MRRTTDGVAVYHRTLDFASDFQTPDFHPSWREALLFIAWFGPRTREARELKLKDIFLIGEATPLEHIRVIIRGVGVNSLSIFGPKN